MQSYWTTLQKTTSRRRALAMTGAGLTGAALLAACGGSSKSEDNGGAAKTASLVASYTDESKTAKRGGTYKYRANFDVVDWDPHQFPGAIGPVSIIYGGLWAVKDGYLEFSRGDMVGDVVESWEVSPDKTTITAKINPNAHFAPVAPVNGRSVDAKDVAFTFDRYKAVSNQRSNLVNSVNPDAPIISMTATDDRTLVIKLKEPNAGIFAQLATFTAGQFFIVPKEAQEQSTLDLKRTPIGTGAFYMSSYTPSVGYTLKRNPNFKQVKGDLPYIDQLDFPIIGEYAGYLAQFRTGAIYLGTAVRAEDILQTKKDVPALDLYKTSYQSNIQRIGFGVIPASPFKDERVRQAWMLTFDRDGFMDAVQNVAKFNSQGVPVETVWESGLQANTFKGWLLDPKGKDFGANSKYFKQDIAEAKKLLDAAGFANGVDTVLRYGARDNISPQTFYNGLDILVNFPLESKLFRYKVDLISFASEYLPKYHAAHGQFDGVTYCTSNLQYDPATYLYNYYHPSGGLAQGSDDTLRDMTKKMTQEFDEEKRKSIGFDIQRYEGQKMFYPRIGGATGFVLMWPAVRNYGVYQGGSQTATNATSGNIAYNFIDPEKPPLKSA